ncbi:cytochrome c3 family protein [Sediminitomix flava]|uniref:Cytochrome c3-like protein n=1 Tax=Sediminitomix flava TaxID=379075 RepID=A0A315ZBB1_SEDFL|nr:cytochrome c3 family protein [Sediminitomix flava]PWJ42865.1 cytochrome c3-like protein [Sediminitomix flava]
MITISRKRRRQWIGFAVGLFITSICYVVLSLPINEQFLSKGPMNTGHEELSCESCHTPSRGNTFQQLQANIMFTVGLRKTEANFGSENVDNKKCLECHERANDRHPLHRFEEPRFAEARKELGVTYCESCHEEHNGVRVTQVNVGYCQSCHEDTELSNDPLEISHKDLIAEEQWTTCLQCHDFHGNHIYHAAESMADTIPMIALKEYFDGGESPYAGIKKFYALSEELWAQEQLKTK